MLLHPRRSEGVALRTGKAMPSRPLSRPGRCVFQIRGVSGACAGGICGSCELSKSCHLRKWLPVNRRAAALASICVSPWQSFDQIRRRSGVNQTIETVKKCPICCLATRSFGRWRLSLFSSLYFNFSSQFVLCPPSPEKILAMKTRYLCPCLHDNNMSTMLLCLQPPHTVILT